MDNDELSSTTADRGQEVFTDLPLYQQIYVTDLVLGPAAAVTLARRLKVDLKKYDGWRVSLTPQAKRALEAQARALMIKRAEEERAAQHALRSTTFDAVRNARRMLGRAR
jgi:hypothetical protein